LIYGVNHGGKRTIRASTGSAPTVATKPPPAAPAASLSLAARPAGVLPAPVQAPAAAPLPGGRILLMGGLDSSFVSAAGVEMVDGRRARTVGQLPVAAHDAAAAPAPGGAYFFGGGEPSKDAILKVSASGRTTVAGKLPVAASDVAAAELHGRYYVVGGYTGTQALSTIVEWRPGSKARVVAHTPVALRYAAVAAAGDTIVIAGGSVDVSATRAVYAFDPANRALHRIATLPRPLTHSSAATLNGVVYLLGGRGAAQGTQTRRVFAVDSRTGRVRSAGHLPRPVSDAGAATVPGGILLAGGRDTAGAVRSEVVRLGLR
jgi:N-acetylneuraminic acid mutarotase